MVPVCKKALAGDKSPSAMKGYIGKDKSILIVDDIQEQREIASGMLTKLYSWEIRDRR